MILQSYNFEFVLQGQTICQTRILLGDMRKAGACAVVDLIQRAEEKFKEKMPNETLIWSHVKFESPYPADRKRTVTVNYRDMHKLIASANKEIDENYQRSLEFSKRHVFMNPPKRPIHLKYP